MFEYEFIVCLSLLLLYEMILKCFSNKFSLSYATTNLHCLFCGFLKWFHHPLSVHIHRPTVLKRATAAHDSRRQANDSFHIANPSLENNCTFWIMGCLGASLDGLLNVANITIPSCCPIGSRNWPKGIARRRGKWRDCSEHSFAYVLGYFWGKQ